MGSEARIAWFSLMRTVVWLLVIPISVYLGWIYSVAFVAACSIYANAASDFAAFRSDRNKQITDRLDLIDNALLELIEILKEI